MSDWRQRLADAARDRLNRLQERAVAFERDGGISGVGERLSDAARRVLDACRAKGVAVREVSPRELARFAHATPPAELLASRLPAVLSAIYLAFNEGYSAARGDDFSALYIFILSHGKENVIVCRDGQLIDVSQ